VIDRRAALLLTIPPLSWAGNAVFARMLVGEVSPLILSLLRWAIALILLAPFAVSALRTYGPTLRAHWKVIATLGVIGVGGYNTFQYLALQTSTAMNVTLIASSTPIFVLVVGTLFFGERVRGLQWVGAALSILGVLLVLTRGDANNLSRLAFVPGDLIMLCANVTWTVYTWVLRRHRPQIPFVPFLAAQMIFGVVAIAPFTAFEYLAGNATFHWNLTTALILAYVALFPSLLAYYCWDRGVAQVGAVIPVLFANLTPLFTAALSTLLLGEAPRIYHGLALLLIVAGIQLASRAPRSSA